MSSCLFLFKNSRCIKFPSHGEVFCEEHLKFLHNNQTKLYCYDYMNLMKKEISFLKQNIEQIKANLELEKKNKEEIIKYYINIIDKLCDWIKVLNESKNAKKK